MASLKNRIIFSFAISLGIFLIFVSVIILSGLNAALRGWYKASEERYAASIIKSIEKLYENNNTKYISDNEIIKTASQYFNDRFSVLLISADGRIIVSHNIRKPPFPPPRDMGPQNNRIRVWNYQEAGNEKQHEHESQMTGKRFVTDIPRWAIPILQNGEPRAFIWVKSIQFTESDTINQHLVRSVLIVLFLGIISSTAAAMIFTSIISGKITKDASDVSLGLGKIASGKRDVVFHESALNEISSIGKSASILQDTLIKEEQARKQWTQDIAHDLRTPTTAIKAQLEAMIDGVLLPEKDRFEKLLTEINRLQLLVEDINSLTKIESAEIKLLYKEVSSNELAAILEERFSFQAEDKKIEIIIKADSFKINCDINGLIRALSNLVQNSIQYSPYNSEVNIRFYKEDGNAIFTIENQGNVPENETEKIFDRLYRGEFGRSTKGSGLGLTIAKAAIEKHGGTINVYNRKNYKIDTVVFVIKIPLNNKTEI